VKLNSDNAYGRIFTTELDDDNTMTAQSCAAKCASENYTISGAEYGTQYEDDVMRIIPDRNLF
jgi:hypothetical protein